MTMTFKELSEKFLIWSEQHRAKKTTDLYAAYLKSYTEYLGESANMPAVEMKSHQLNDYISLHPEWSNTYKNAIVTGLNRIMAWGVDSDYLEKNPIRKAFKPSAESRKTYATQKDYDAILYHLEESDSFRDFVIFLWHSFSRPQEVRHIEARHVDLAKGIIVFPKKESKGKKYERCILILKDTRPIIERLVVKYPEGKLFRNSDGNPLTKDVVCKRFSLLSKKIGKKVIPYEFRHSGITFALESGVNIVDVSAAAGHRNVSTTSRIYSHVHQNTDRLRNVFGG